MITVYVRGRYIPQVNVQLDQWRHRTMSNSSTKSDKSKFQSHWAQGWTSYTAC
jgi:hypothetical protein